MSNEEVAPSRSDHDMLIRVVENLSTLTQNIDKLVDTVRETDRATRETQKMLQDHIVTTGHQLIIGRLDVIDLKLMNLEKDSQAMESTVRMTQEHDGNWKIFKAASAVLLPVFTGIVVLVVKLFFHL